MRKYPNRFLGLAKVKEVEAFKDEQIEELRRCVRGFGFRGVFFQRGSMQLAGNNDELDNRKYDPFWEAVKSLGGMVYLHGFFDEWREMANLARRYSEVPVVHTLPTWNFPRNGIGRMPREGKVHIRQDIKELLSLPNFYFEISAIAYGAAYEYPYTELIPTFRPYYDEFGGSKFIWGSDMPNLERWCTYQQCIDYLRLHWDFISREDKALITGGNAARIFKAI